VKPVRARSPLATALAAILTIAVGAVGVLASSREDLVQNVSDLVGAVGGTPTIVGFCAGACVAFVAARHLSSHDTKVLDDEGHRRRFRAALEDGHITTVKMFGYTGETSLVDLLDYNDRYRPITVRMLLRNWLVERAEQDKHNARPDTSESRPWDKADAIKKIAVEKWPHAMRREMRFYDGNPVIKASILLKDNRPVTAFVSFFCWKEVPDNGGSPFKGVPRGVVQLDASNPNEAAILEYLDSQFELAWRCARSREQILLREIELTRSGDTAK